MIAARLALAVFVFCLTASFVEIIFPFVASAFVYFPLALLLTAFDSCFSTFAFSFLPLQAALEFKSFFSTRSYSFPSGWLTDSEYCNRCCWAVRAPLHLRHRGSPRQESDRGSQPWRGHLCVSCSPKSWQLRSSWEQFLGAHYELAQAAITEIGFTLSMGKNYVSRKFLIVNSEGGWVMPEGPFEKLAYLNTGLLYVDGNSAHASLSWESPLRDVFGIMQLQKVCPAYSALMWQVLSLCVR